MPRTIKGITLTPEERLQAGYTDAHATGVAKPPTSHTCTVTLPNGTSCPVTYTRYSTRSHEFRFGQPLNQRHWVQKALPGGIPAIEERARQLVTTVFSLAQQQEQQAMRVKSTPARRKESHDDGPDMSATVAEKMVVLYAICVRHRSGHLLRLRGRNEDK